ncbi:MAG TPA: DUF935 family protein [Polyangiaceae bacterium]|nr:DUF935 family protein [Polyangiaceae bacterium]
MPKSFKPKVGGPPKRKGPSSGWATPKVYGAPGTAMPPSKGAPPPVPPIAVTSASRPLAPIPINDRYPVVIGHRLTLEYVSSVFRLATTGYRQQFVDLLNELLEQDPHLFSVLSKRIMSTANGRVDIIPAQLPDDDRERDAADELAQFVQREIGRIPNFTERLAELLWGLYHGLSAQEIFWTRDSDGWHVERLGFIHSRRLAYPDGQSWSLYVWDQGQVYGWQSAWGSPTNSGVFGLRVADYPGKFLVYAPQLRGDYPTRDGLGRQTATWASFKRVGARGCLDYLEGFAQPFKDVTYSTQGGPPGEGGGTPRQAVDEDIALAGVIAADKITGGAGYHHSDAVKIELKTPDGGGTPKLTWPEWIQICNAEMSKAALGSTLGTDGGVGGGSGSRSLGEVQERGEVDIEQYDATVLGEAIRSQLVYWLVKLNRPEQLHLLPHVYIHVDVQPDPKSLTATAREMTDMGLPVDGDALAEETGIPLIANEADAEGNVKPRRTTRAGELLATLKGATSIDIPIDVDKAAALLGVPVIAIEDMDKKGVRRTRLVATEKENPIEPTSDDPNDPNASPPPEPGPAAPQDATPTPDQG